jgi:hypothetical protein
MNGLWQDLIIVLSMGIFGVWVIYKHYNIKSYIHNLRNDIYSCRADMKLMQGDLIEFRQNLINIDAKYRKKDEWVVSKIQQITEKDISVQNAIDTVNDAITMSKASEMEPDDV